MTGKKHLPLSPRLSGPSHQVVGEEYQYLPIQSPSPSFTQSLISIDLQEVDWISRILLSVRRQKPRGAATPKITNNSATARGLESRNPDTAQCPGQYSILTPDYHILLKKTTKTQLRGKGRVKKTYVHSNFLKNQDCTRKGEGRGCSEKASDAEKC